MKTMTIYEPAMCCSTGLCGVSVDPELLRISTVIRNLERQGIRVQRFNLNNYPNEFVKNIAVSQIMMEQGAEILPVTIIDGAIAKKSAYPTNEEISLWLGVPKSLLGGVSKAGRPLSKSSKTVGGKRGGAR